jgi:hypothetical protein
MPQVNDAPPPEPMPVASDTPPPDTNNQNGEPGGENPDAPPRRPPPRPRNVREQAVEAFRSGNDEGGFKYLNLYFAGTPTAGEELAEKMAWFPALARPALVPRIGIAVQYNIESVRDAKLNPMPIGSKAVTDFVDQMQKKDASDSRIGGSGRTSKFGRGGRRPVADMIEHGENDPLKNASPQQQLTYYTGEVGEMFMDALNEQIESGQYGRVMQDLAKDVGRSTRGRGRGGRGGGGGAPDDPAVAGGEEQPSFDQQPADGGGGGQPGRGGASPLKRTWASRSVNAKDPTKNIQQLRPAVLWLGKSDERESINKAAEAANVDVIAIFEVTLREARTGNFTNNTTKVRLVNRKTSKPLFSPEPLVNLTVEQWRQKDEKGEDPVVREITKAVEALDKAIKPTALPEALTAERAKKRIETLVAEKPEDPLPALVEARFYTMKGLLPKDDLQKAATDLLGDGGYNKLIAKAKETSL